MILTVLSSGPFSKAKMFESNQWFQTLPSGYQWFQTLFVLAEW